MEYRVVPVAGGYGIAHCGEVISKTVYTYAAHAQEIVDELNNECNTD